MQTQMQTTVTKWGITFTVQLRRLVMRLSAKLRNERLSWLQQAALLLLLLSFAVTLWQAEQSLPPAPEAKAAPVLCISAVQGADGMPQVVYQGAGRTLEEAMREQGMGQLVEAGYTVTHQACFDRWQAAADFVTDGQVILPEAATERDFVMALLKWKQQYP